MTSQPGYQTMTIHILLTISRRKGNQGMEFHQTTEWNKRSFFFKNYAENEATRLDLFLIYYFNIFR